MVVGALFFLPHLTQNQHPTKKLPESGGNLAEVMSEVEEWCPRSWVRESEGVVCWERGLRFQKGGLRFWAKLSLLQLTTFFHSIRVRAYLLSGLFPPLRHEQDVFLLLKEE